MLPPRLKRIKADLEAKGHSKRTVAEDRLLDEINEVDKAIDEAGKYDRQLIEGIKARNSGVMGPSTDTCPTCGQRW